MKDKENTDTKFITLTERMKTHQEMLEDTEKRLVEATGRAGKLADEGEEWFTKKGGEEKRRLALLAAENHMNYVLDQLLLILLRDNLSMMAQVVNIVNGQKEITISVKRNFVKAMNQFVAASGAAQKAREAYTK